MGRSIGVGTIAKGLFVVGLLYVTDVTLTRFRQNEIRQIQQQQTAALKELKLVSDSIREFKKEYWQLHLSADEMDSQMGDLKQQLANVHKPRPTVLPVVAEQEPSQADAGDELKVDGFRKNHVVTSGACRPKDPAAQKKGLPKFVFVAGIEGSGHHALKDVWWSLQKAGMKVELVVYDQVFHSLGIENHASYHYSSIKKAEYVKHMGPTFEQARTDGSIVIDAQNSYPMGKGAGPLAHPDLLMLSELDGVLFDLRVIVLFRDPVDSSLSAVRRFQNKEQYLYKNVEFQARMVSESLVNIHNALPHMPCNHYMVIDYEKLIHHPRDFIAPLEKLVGAGHDVLHGAFEKLGPREKKLDSPEKAVQRALLQSFFTVQEKLWPWLVSA